MSKIFLTGASGYIGGQVLHELTTAGQKYSITALIRDKDKANTIAKAYPDVKIVVSDLDDTATLKKTVSEVDIVLHLAATGHLPSVKAIHQGLLDRQSPVYWVQVSGASVLAAPELANSAFVPGSESSAEYNDFTGIGDIRDLIRAYPSRAVDNYILDVAAEKNHIHVAAVFPPIIYGKGQGPVNQRSIQIPSLTQAILKRGTGVRVGQGKSRWGNVHVADVARIFSSLAQNAASANTNDARLWNNDGLYFTGVGELTFGKISEIITAEAGKQGLIPKEAPVVELPKDEVDKVLPHGTVLYGTNARAAANRAREVLGWKPQEPTLEEDIVRTVTDEAEKLKATL